ncbi:hypothetical protein [Microcystis phage Mae-JY24]
MPDLTSVIAQIQELQKQAGKEAARAERRAAECRHGRHWQQRHHIESYVAGAEAQAYARVLELLKGVDGE